MPGMQHVANVATANRPRRPHSFLKLHPEELGVLAVLPCWQFRLFAALVMYSEFSTGKGQVQMWQLIAALRPLQPAWGGPRHDVPDHDRVRRALLAFERARIVRRRPERSEAEGAIFFGVSKRAGNFARP
jgi:hypothetical protein